MSACVSPASRRAHKEGALSQASLRPHKADDLAVVRLSVRTVHCQHEEISLTVRCIVWHDLFRRNLYPRAVDQSVPRIVRMWTIAVLDLELGIHNIARAAA